MVRLRKESLEESTELELNLVEKSPSLRHWKGELWLFSRTGESCRIPQSIADEVREFLGEMECAGFRIDGGQIHIVTDCWPRKGVFRYE